MDLKGCLGRLFVGPCMHIVVAEEPGILLTNSPGWDFMSEIGLARAGSNEVSRQHNKSNVWFYCFYQKCYFLDLSHWLIDSWLMTHWLIWLIKHLFSYPGALPPMIENFRRAFSPGPTECPKVSEDVHVYAGFYYFEQFLCLLTGDFKCHTVPSAPLSFQTLMPA